MLCDSKGSFAKKFNCKLKGVLSIFDLREASINSIPFISLVINTKKNEERKTVKINKKSGIDPNIQDRQIRKSKRLKKI